MLVEGSADQAGLNSARLDRATELVRSWVNTGVVPGAVLLVARHGIVARYEAFGQMTPEAPHAMAPDTIFPVASIAKPVVATAAMLLVEQGRLWLDDPVATLVPAFAPEGQGIVRVRHLLTHTSGLTAQLGDLIETRAPPAEITAACCRGTLTFHPGSAIAYESAPFWVMGAVITQITGQPLDQFCRTNLFEPLGMHDTSFVPDRATYPRIASVAGDDMINTAYFRSLGSPSGGLFSSARDLALFAQMFLEHGRGPHGQILSPPAAHMMLTDQWPHLEQHEPDVTWRGGLGLGWGLRSDRQLWYVGELASPRTFSHSGATGTLVWADPVWNLVGVLLTNQAGEPNLEYARRRSTVSNIITAAVLPP